MQRILLDTDTGVDDALAIILALNSPELNVEAITSVSGNVHVDLCTRNLLMTLEGDGLSECPICAKGESQPLVKPLVTAAHVHGSDGLGDATQLLKDDGSHLYPDPQPRLAAMSAVDLIIDRAGQYPDELVLVPVGPLTNIAKAMIKHPARMRRIREIVLMGVPLKPTETLRRPPNSTSTPIRTQHNLFSIWCAGHNGAARRNTPSDSDRQTPRR